MNSTKDILEFWFDELSPEDWFRGGENLDAEIRRRFEADWEVASGGGYRNWNRGAEDVLALMLLLDQFPRNMFRDSPKAFATDVIARSVALRTVRDGSDLALEPEARRVFLYLPFMHSEHLADQDFCIGLISGRIPESGKLNLVHARAHREIIRKFQRFPYRNKVLKRATTQQEAAWMEAGGYASELKKFTPE